MYIGHVILSESQRVRQEQNGGCSSVGSSTGLWFQVSWVRVPSPTFTMKIVIKGYRQAVRHRILIPACGGSNPPSPV